MAGTKADYIADRASFGGIKRYLALPCAVPKQIYVESFYPALLTALWSYNSPDPRHLYHKYGPGDLTRAGERVPRSTLCEVKGILKDAFPVQSPEHEKFLRTVFTISEIADIATWYYFVGSILADFLEDWADGVVKQKPCSNPAQGRKNSGFAPFGASFSNGRWGTFDFNFDDPHNPAGPCGVVLRPGQGCIVAAACSGQDVGGVPVPLNTRILRQSDGKVLDENQGEEVREQGILIGYRKSHTFVKYINNNASVGLELIEWQCTCPNMLPDDEVFPQSTGTCYRGFIF